MRVLFITVTLFFYSCQDKLDLAWESISIDRNIELHSLIKSNERLIAAGGDQFSIGIVCNSLDDGSTWQCDSLSPITYWIFIAM